MSVTAKAELGTAQWTGVGSSLVGQTHAELRAMLEAEERSGVTMREEGMVGVRSTVTDGRGQWDYIHISDHLILSYTDAVYDQDAWINVPGGDLFKIRILLEGVIANPGTLSDIVGPSAYLAVYPGSASNGYFVRGRQRLRMLVLHCNRELITQAMGIAADAVPEPLAALYSPAGALAKGANVRLASEILRAANEILRVPAQYPRGLRRSYVEARCREIVCAVLRQLSEPDFVVPEGAKLTMRDISRVHEVRDILLEQYAHPPSISRLARMVGLNQTKLKFAFKLVFGITAYDLVRKCRMDAARELLLTTDRTIAEISYEVGFEYPANFTNAFQRVYGCLPSNLRRRT